MNDWRAESGRRARGTGRSAGSGELSGAQGLAERQGPCHPGVSTDIRRGISKRFRIAGSDPSGRGQHCEQHCRRRLVGHGQPIRPAFFYSQGLSRGSLHPSGDRLCYRLPFSVRLPGVGGGMRLLGRDANPPDPVQKEREETLLRQPCAFGLAPS